MVKNTLIYLATGLLLSITASAQNFICKNGVSSFFSQTPLENIDAVNSKVGSVINTNSQEIVVQMTISEFKFKNRLMEEHFNENYLESEKFPNAIFKGKIQESIDWTKVGTYDVSAKGILTIHGVSKERILNGKVTIDKNKIVLNSDFDVMLVDHKIDVPKLVFAKIAEKIKVQNKFEYVILK